MTLAVIGFVTILIKFFIAGISIKGIVVFGAAPDAATIGALLTPTLGAYVARRYTDKKYDAAATEKTITSAAETVQSVKTKVVDAVAGKPSVGV